MNKMLRYSFMLLLGFTALLTGCKETEPTDPNQQLLANKDWYTDGLYFQVSGTYQKVLAPNLTTRFSKTSTVNTTTVNGTPLGAAAVWTLSVDAKTLTVYYPSVSGNGATLASQALKVEKLTATELWVTAPANDDIQLFGIINLSATSQYRFTTTKPAEVTPLPEEATLKAVTWTGTNTNQTAGVFTTIGGGIYTWKSYADITFKFDNFSPLKLNYVTVGGLPTPATWVLSKDASNNLKITIAYPKVGAIPAKVFVLDVATLSANSLIMGAAESLTFSSVFTLEGAAQLRLVPKP
jgi:hypothetical protein